MRVGIFINKSVGALALSLVAVLTYAAPAIVAPVAVGPAAVAWQAHQPVGIPVPALFSKGITEAPVPSLPAAEIAEAPSSPTLSAACLAEASTPTSPQVTSSKRFSVKTKAQRYIETARVVRLSIFRLRSPCRNRRRRHPGLLEQRPAHGSGLDDETHHHRHGHPPPRP